MSQYRVTFESPGYLVLLILVPFLWWLSYRALAPLGQGRRGVALVLRCLIVGLFVLAVAQTQMVRISKRLTVIYLLDRSLSIPPEGQTAMIDYLNKAVERHRADDDRVGVILFGRDALIEVPAFAYNITLPPNLQAPLESDYTNLASAMRLAMASFPEDAARRIVIVTDGNENLGSAAQEAQALAGAGVGIDVVPVYYEKRGEIVTERVVLPPDIRRGLPFDLKVVMSSTRQSTGADSGEVSGRLVVQQTTRGVPRVVSEQKVTLPPGKRVFTVRQQLDAAGAYGYDAVFFPDNPGKDDTMTQNNRASAFTHVKGKGQVLLIEPGDSRNQYESAVKALAEHNIEVEVRSTKDLFASLGELQQFDAVILANVPRDAFVDDNQVQMLVRNTQQMGAGLVMLGGPDSFGAGGWADTELEKAMPVDFTIKSAKVIPRGALVMVMHASEIAQGNHWQKKIAEEALKTLGPRDYCGVIQYGGGGRQGGATTWLWTPGMAATGENREMMLGKLSRMTPMDMPEFEPGMVLAHQGLMALEDVGVRHMIIISDGDPQPPSPATINNFRTAKITVSTVAVGAHGPADSTRLAQIAGDTGGRYYAVNNPSALPRIFQREARRVTVPLRHENESGMVPQITQPHEMLGGIEAVPPITGYILTTVKQNPLVEVVMVAPEPGPAVNRTLLAGWTYGLGRTVVLTTDATARWSKSWLAWQDYAKLVSQIVRWTMRPAGDEGKFSVATDFRDGQVRVVLTALDKNDEFLNFLSPQMAGVGPSLQASEGKLEQVAPGRYVGTFPAREAGAYMIAVSPGAGHGTLNAGVNVPYSDEFRNLEPNQPLMEQLADFVPEGGEPGKLIQSPDGLDRLEPLLEHNSFRHDLARATSSQDVWPFLLLMGSCLLFADVFVRRVQVSFAWVPVVAAKMLGRKPPPPPAEMIQRLQSRKAEVEDRIAQLRASARFEPSAQLEPDRRILEEPFAGEAAPRRPAAAPDVAQKPPEEEGYTARLLKAKERAWEKGKS